MLSYSKIFKLSSLFLSNNFPITFRHLPRFDCFDSAHLKLLDGVLSKFFLFLFTPPWSLHFLALVSFYS